MPYPDGFSDERRNAMVGDEIVNDGYDRARAACRDILERVRSLQVHLVRTFESDKELVYFLEDAGDGPLYLIGSLNDMIEQLTEASIHRVEKGEDESKEWDE